MTDFVYCIGHLGEQVREYCGDGGQWGVRVRYVDEGEWLRGTGGALRLALDADLLEDTFVMVYGDSYTPAPVAEIFRAVKSGGSLALMCVIHNENRWDRSNCTSEPGRPLIYDKARKHPRAPEMQYIDYGLSAFRRETIRSHSCGQRVDLADVIHALSLDGQLAGFAVTSASMRSVPRRPSRIRGICHPDGRGQGVIGILGGGLAGLTIAAYLKQPCEVLEAAERGGGHCDSVCEAGFTYDAGGPHIIFSRDESILSEMVALLGDNVLRRRRNNKIYFDGRFIKYPFENGLNELGPQDRFECLYHYLCNSHPAPSNFAEWMYHTFGSGITEKYLLPYNEKIWKTAAREMSIDWVDGRIPRPPLEDIVKSAVGIETEGYTHQLHFWYPAHGGIEQLPAALNKRVARFTPSFVVKSIRRAAPIGT